MRDFKEISPPLPLGGTYVHAKQHGAIILNSDEGKSEYKMLYTNNIFGKPGKSIELKNS